MLSGSANALTTYTGFAVVLFAGIAVRVAVRAAPARAGRAAPVQGAGAIRSRPASSPSPAWPSSLNALWTDLVVPIRTGTPWGPAAAGLIVIGLGVPLYFFFSTPQVAPASVRRIVALGSVGVRLTASRYVDVSSAHSVSSASAPSDAANSRNDAGDPRKT